MVLASVSRRCTRLSASTSGPRAASSSAAHGIELLPRRDMLALAIAADALGLRQCLLRRFDRAEQLIEIAEAAGLLLQLLDFALDVGDLLIEPGKAVAMGAHAALKLVALARSGRPAPWSVRRTAARRRRASFRFPRRAHRAAALFDARLDLAFQFGVFGIEPLQAPRPRRRIAAARAQRRPKTASAGGRVRRRAHAPALPRGRASRGRWSGAAARRRRGLRLRASAGNSDARTA